MIGGPGNPCNIKDGPYSLGFDYDKWGNMTHRYGWGGEVQQGETNHQSSDINYYYSSGKNQRDSFTYDAAGNLLNDSQTYRYDATGQQVYASGFAGSNWGPVPTYHDEPIQLGVTTVQALHITELRTAINLLRNHFGLANYPWTTSATTSDYINASPIIEMRVALDQALGTGSYAPNLAQGQPVKAIHIQELRDRVTTAWNAYGSGITQAYDGNGLRVKKSEYGATTYYVRSTVLGGEVIAELSSNGSWSRGYVYAGSGLLSVQEGNAVYWMYEDPVTKSKRVCDQNGVTVSGIETDPFGADTLRSFSQAFQPKKFTSYDRDANGSDEAMFRRYNRWHARFDQPDPYDGSYALSDPQSLNRYAYTNNDPVNFVDPRGLDCWQLVMITKVTEPGPNGKTTTTEKVLSTWCDTATGGTHQISGGRSESMPGGGIRRTDREVRPATKAQIAQLDKKDQQKNKEYSDCVATAKRNRDREINRANDEFKTDVAGPKTLAGYLITFIGGSYLDGSAIGAATTGLGAIGIVGVSGAYYGGARIAIERKYSQDMDDCARILDSK